MSTEVDGRRRVFLRSTAAVAVGLATAKRPVRAATTQVRVASQIGLAYLPLALMQHDQLWEKHAARRGVSVEVSYLQLGGGASLNDALLSGSVEIAAAGLAPLLVLWDRTRTNLRVRAISALNASPMYLLGNRPGLQSIRDLNDHDRIAVPSLRVSIQAVVLGMGVEQAFGPGTWNRFEAAEVVMAHPEAYAALISGGTPITAYMSSSPFQERALKQPGITKLADSFKILGGPSTFSVAYAKESFWRDNPQLFAAFHDAQDEAATAVKTDPVAAITKYMATTGDRTEPSLLSEILHRSGYDFDVTPKNTKPVADFMVHTGIIRSAPESWKDYFAADVHVRGGS